MAAVAAAAGFDWASITPSEHLQYHACYDGLRCARLSVPLDWLDANNPKKVAIAITTIPAKVPTDDPSFGGTIIFNPGGPGGSGTAAVQIYGPLMQEITEGKKHYEILSFDPRGVSFTTPRADCFGESHVFARDSLKLETRGIGGMDASLNGLKRFLALDEAFGKLCITKDVEDDIMSYVSTASVARDIIEITDRVEELRHSKHAIPRSLLQRPLAATEELAKKKPARVLYWGVSYGTILGNTLASMFPGRMGRVVLDGVDNVYDYYSGAWETNLLDTEKLVDYFYDACFDGAKDCPLWKESDASGKDIKNRIDKLIAHADAHPLSFVQSDGPANVAVITGNDIRQAFKLPLYQPLPTGFENLAVILAKALEGNYTFIDQSLDVPPLQDACNINDPTMPRADDATTAILCSDADFANPDGPYHGQGKRHGVPFWRDYVATLVNQSSILGPWWSEISSRCSGWRSRPKWRYTGPFTTPSSDPNRKEGVPAAPILFTSTRLDPVTPLRQAFAMSHGHPGSAVLIHETIGHCATFSGWSECFREAVRAYFDDGVVPENGTVCDTTCKPFSKDGKCLPPSQAVAAGDENHHSSVDAVLRSAWSFKPLAIN